MIKRKLLVVGDSFMRPDIAYPGEHWSEMLFGYDVVMNAQSGASNGIIAYNFYRGLEHQPDAVVAGFTFTSRIEFQTKQGWTTANDIVNTTLTQQKFADQYAVYTSIEMQTLKDAAIARSILSTLKERKIPVAWTLNGLFNNLAQLPYPSDPWINLILSDYFGTMIPTNLATYPNFKSSPGFHTDDRAWQNRFAEQATAILQYQLT